ncbi:MAG: hypothetical protein IT487_13730 [Chromatiaceae bacterium]|nr:hypothetical protein [Chromatiaceae bacterium]
MSMAILDNVIYRPILAALVGALVLWLGVWWYQQLGSDTTAPALVMTDEQLKLVAGEGGKMEDGILIRRRPPGKPAMVMAATLPFEAGQFARFSWDIRGLEPQQNLALIWVTNTDPNKPRTRKITPEERAVGFLQLEDDPTWRGQILKFGLLVTGNLPEPVLVKGLTLEGEPPTPLTALRSLAGDWTHQEPWTGRSINFHVGAATKDRLLTPVLLVGLWVGLGSLLLVFFDRLSSSRHLLGGLALLFLGGWLLLDLRWQWLLATRLEETYERYGHLTPDQRPSARPDAHVVTALDQLRKALPEEPSRIFLLSKNPSDYLTLRVRYHLLPLRVFASDHLPNPEQIQAGDHFLVLANPEVVRFDGTHKRLVDGEASLPVEPLSKVQGFGGLYRIPGGG